MKVGIMIVCCVLMLLHSSCITIEAPPVETVLTTKIQTLAPTIEPILEITATPQSTATPNITAVSATTAVVPINTASMYSSYANMVSYDTATGWAEFDYFNMLKGAEAVQWLIDNEGYTQTEAQDIVDDWADSEFVYSNTNPRLRTIDLSSVPIKLMFNSDGTQVVGATSVVSTVNDVTSVYNYNPLYLFQYFFFYIHVDSDGNVTQVEQVYWP